MAKLKVLNTREWTNISIEVLKALKRLDSATVRDHLTVLYILQDIIGAIDNAFEER